MTNRALMGLWLLLSISWPALAQTEYYALFMDGKKVGRIIHTRSVWSGKVTTVDDMSITMSRLGTPLTFAVTETCVETTDGKPLSFKIVEQSGSTTMTSEGTIDTTGTLHVTNSLLGSVEKRTMDWPKGAVMEEGSRLRTPKGGPKPGTTYETSTFSPSTLQMVREKVTIGQKKQVDLFGRIVMLTEVTRETNDPDSGPTAKTSYVDENMRALKSRMVAIDGMLMEVIACSQEVAMGRNDTFDMIDKMFVKSPEPIGDVQSAASITYTLSPAPGVKLSIPSTDNQKVQVLPDGRIRLTVEPVTPTGGLLLYKSNNARLLKATKPTRFLQSDREEIVALARKAVGDTTDSVEAARRIEAFVAGYVRNYSLSVGHASAAEVAQSREGDCSEFAVLTAALCRAVGIPAQVCSGVAYIGSFRGVPGFAGHAWTQAYVGVDAQGKSGKWVGLDATFKSNRLGGYDAGHITLDVGNGDPDDSSNLAIFLSQVKIEKIEVGRAG